MKKLCTLLMLTVIFTGCKNEIRDKNPTEEPGIFAVAKDSENTPQDSVSIEIQPISHATFILKWGEAVIYNDPTGGAKAFEGKEDPDFILISDIHGDHMNVETLKAINLGNTKIIVPKAVKDQLPEDFKKQLVVLNNGESREFMGFDIQAIPMYNLPIAPGNRHTKGRGNGYILEKNGKRVYIAGDTEDIPEMRNLKNIDIALVPMNLPYTMSVEQAAEGVLAFEPKKVYPYHYRGLEGLADVEKFKELVNNGNKDIEVVLLDWYPSN